MKTSKPLRRTIDQVKMLKDVECARQRALEVRATVGHMLMLAECLSHSIPAGPEGESDRESWKGIVDSFIEFNGQIDDLSWRLSEPADWYADDAAELATCGAPS